MATIAAEMRPINRAHEYTPALPSAESLLAGQPTDRGAAHVDVQARITDSPATVTFALIAVFFVAVAVCVLRAFAEYADGRTALRAFIHGCGWAGYTLVGGVALLTLLALIP
ncbi:hypothetical protein ACWEKT_13540 [Nocardia takedensis]